MTKCQSIEVELEISGHDRTLTYRPREVIVSDGTRLVHTSLGGDLESVWAGDLGDRYVEVVHLGSGPEGGELIVVDTTRNTVAIGDLYTEDVPTVTPDWPVTIDLVLGLLTADTTVVTSAGTVDRDTIEAFHQRLLGALHG